MADKLDYTIQIDGDQYDITAADSLHADLANQVEEALVVKKSVRKASIEDIKNNESLAIENLKANIGVPSEAIGVTEKDANGNIISIVRDADNAFAFKGDYRAEIEVVPSSGGVFTGPIYAPDIDDNDGFNINKFQVTNYNSVDTIIRELKGFPVYEWTGTQVLALTEGNPPTMLPFKVIIYTGSEDDNGWKNREKLRLINSMPDGTKPFCDTECKFFLINATNDSDNGGRILLGTYTPTSEENPSSDHKFCTYEELRVKEADHAIDADVAQKLKKDDLGNNITPIYLDDGTAKAGYLRAGGTGVTLNGTQMFRSDSNTTADTTASFYAPTTAGETSQVLLSNGGKTDKTPTWAAQGDLSVKEAQKVTESIRDVDIDDIFVKSGDNITSEVLNAYNVTGAIYGTAIGEIFNTVTNGTTTTISEVKQANKATTADNAAISDTIHIHKLGGSGGTGSAAYKPGDTETSGNYIIYGNVDPSEFTKTGKQCTDAFNTIGNIYIKIPATS